MVNFKFFFLSNLYQIMGFQSPATPVMEGIIDLHNYIFYYLILIFFFVLWMFIYILYNFLFLPNFLFDFFFDLNFSEIKLLYTNIILFDNNFLKFIKQKLLVTESNINFNFFFSQINIYYLFLMKTRLINHHTLIELIWTIVPSFILICIALPSFSLLYSMNEIIKPQVSVKAIGYQWFWSYEYAHEYKLNFIEFDYLKDSLGYAVGKSRNYLLYDSVMIVDDELPIGYHRLLDVDHQMLLPAYTHIKLIITAGDVLHSWSVPSLGIKVDAVPGRLSQIGVYIKYQGVFYGQCSELCGVNHGFMPIVVKAVNPESFWSWYHKNEGFFLH